MKPVYEFKVQSVSSVSGGQTHVTLTPAHDSEVNKEFSASYPQGSATIVIDRKDAEHGFKPDQVYHLVPASK